MADLTDTEIKIITRLLHRTWSVIYDETYGTLNRTQVWHLTLDRAELQADSELEKLALKKLALLNNDEIEWIKRLVFTAKYYMGGR
jgi:hypothetical protein